MLRSRSLVRTSLLVFASLAALACGDSSASSPDDAGAPIGDGGDARDSGGRDGGDRPTDVDLDRGSWRLTNLSNSEGQAGFHGRLGVRSDGRRWVAWAESPSGMVSLADILAATWDGSAWATTPITEDETLARTQPDLTVGGSGGTLVWNGPASAGMTSDVFVSTLDASGEWSAPTNLTAPFDAFNPGSDFGAVPVRLFGGDYVVAHLINEPSKVTVTPTDLVAMYVDAEGTASPPEPLIDDIGPACRVDGAIGVSDTVHFFRGCGVSSGARIRHISGAPGRWSVDDHDFGAGAAEVRVAVSGRAVHIVYRRYKQCGEEACDDIEYRRLEDDVWSAPILVTNTELVEATPTIAAVDDGTIAVAYELRTADSDRVLGFSWAPPDATAFRPTVVVTPDEPDHWDTPTDAQFDPTTGTPVLVVQRTIRRSDPFDVEILVADFIPDP